eukprot:SAG31_NODE_29213_length_399_cov_0.690000_1_plen_44_part_01
MTSDCRLAAAAAGLNLSLDLLNLIQYPVKFFDQYLPRGEIFRKG